MYQKLIIVGHLGSDPELRYAPSGKPVANFSVATNRTYANSDGEQVKETTWFRVTVWGKQAENVAKYLHKGRQVLVEGQLIHDTSTGGPRVWTDQNGNARASFEVNAYTVKFLGGGSQQQGGNSSTVSDLPADDEDLPF